MTINDTLRPWLAFGKLPKVNVKKRVMAVRKLATPLNWSHDCLRHSFCSYAVPILGAKVAAAEAGHSEGVLFQHYRELVTVESAREFWAIRP